MDERLKFAKVVRAHKKNIMWLWSLNLHQFHRFIVSKPFHEIIEMDYEPQCLYPLSVAE